MLPHIVQRSLFMSLTLLALGLFAFPSAARADDSRPLLGDEGPFRLYLPGVITAGDGDAINQEPTQPHTPTPVDKATNQPTDVTLSWQGGDPDGDAVTYTIYLDTINPPLGGAIDQTATTYDPGDLDAETTYYWQVFAADERGAITAGPVWRFTTSAVPANRAPLTPAYPRPADQATGQYIDVDLAWFGGDLDGDVVTYTVSFGTSNPPPQVATVVGEMTYDPGILGTETTYYWRVVARDIHGAITAGPVWRFTTANRAPLTPYNPRPADQATGQSANVNLAWAGGDPDGDAVTYDVYFGTSNPPPVAVADQSERTYDPGTLEAETTYYWQVIVADGRGLTTKGPVWRFTTGSAPEEFTCSSVTEIPQIECEALVALYTSTNGLDSSGWLRTATPCSWPGVLCNFVSVYALELQGYQLSGSIPPELGNLVNLVELDLSHNDLSGSIPPELGNLANLTELVLNDNQLSGSIPPQLGNLANVYWFFLYNNRLSGSIPPELGNLINVRLLYLHNNQLNGSIPSELGNLANLDWLYLNNNQLSGSIPSQLGNLANLELLHLNNNQLSGSIPSELGNLALLRVLVLNDNQLNGSIPPQLGNLFSLTGLALNNNLLRGPLPLSLTNLTRLRGFYFQATQLCVPSDSTFQAWLYAIEDMQGTGVTCP